MENESNKKGNCKNNEGLLMDTPTAIMITQLPIAIGAILCAVELYLLRKEFVKLVEKISKRK